VLLGGLAVALIVVFARPIRYLLDLARDVEQSSGLALVPALGRWPDLDAIRDALLKHVPTRTGTEGRLDPAARRRPSGRRARDC
jgi:hypothetical protein